MNGSSTAWNIKIIVIVWLILALSLPHASFAAEGQTEGGAGVSSLEAILEKVEQRYSGEGFFARFSQTSTLQALDIADHANGRIFVQAPGKMRWEYISPEPQVIVSDGVQLWIFRPEDDQVLVGKAPEFFGDGKGASFLSDIRQMRENFHISLERTTESGDHVLQLDPSRETPDIAEIYLTVSGTSYLVEKVETVNAYGDRTEITLSDQTFELPDGEELFRFEIPEGAEVLQLDAQSGLE